MALYLPHLTHFSTHPNLIRLNHFHHNLPHLNTSHTHFLLFFLSTLTTTPQISLTYCVLLRHFNDTLCVYVSLLYYDTLPNSVFYYRMIHFDIMMHFDIMSHCYYVIHFAIASNFPTRCTYQNVLLFLMIYLN